MGATFVAPTSKCPRRHAPDTNLDSDYVSRVPDGSIADLLAEQSGRVVAAFRAARPRHMYAEGKWTSEEVIGHVVDIERVFSYRAMCFTRGLGDVGLAGVDQHLMVPASRAAARGAESFVLEFDALRRANVTMVEALEAEQLDDRGIASGTEMSARAMLYVLYGHAEHHTAVLLARIIHEREAPVRPNGAVARKIREWSGGGPVGPVSTL